MRVLQTFFAIGFVCAALLTPKSAEADIVVGVDHDADWLGFMNVYEKTSDLRNLGDAVLSSAWEIEELKADFDKENSQLSLRPNRIDDEDPFWYQQVPFRPYWLGNKTMEANLYVEETDKFAGETVTFSGEILLNNLYFESGDRFESSIFIRDFAPDYSSFNETLVYLEYTEEPEPFSISLAMDPGAGRHLLYGFQTVGENVHPEHNTYDDVEVRIATFGSSAVPEPSGLLMIGLAGAGIALRRRR